jgi:peroxiredoxin
MKFTAKLFLILSLIMALFACKEDQTTKDEKDRIANLEKLGVDTQAKSNYEALTIGSNAPDFSGTDQFGNEHSLNSLTQDSSLVVVFYRGQWCPICSRYLSKFATDLDTLRELGARVIAVTPELKENVEKTIEKTGLTIPILSDLDHSIMNAFQVDFKVNEAYNAKIIKHLNTDIALNNGADEAYLPIPATYVIGPDKKIKFVHYDPNYKVRASVHNIARHIR